MQYLSKVLKSLGFLTSAKSRLTRNKQKSTSSWIEKNRIAKDNKLLVEVCILSWIIFSTNKVYTSNKLYQQVFKKKTSNKLLSVCSPEFPVKSISNSVTNSSQKLDWLMQSLCPSQHSIIWSGWVGKRRIC